MTKYDCASSPGELEPVFNAMLENATRICEARFGTLYLYGEDGLTLAATHNAPSAFAEARRRGPIRPAPDTALGQVMATKKMAQVADVAATRAYAEGNPVVADAVKLAGMRTVAAVPMLKDNRLIGIIASYRQEVRPFTEKQIALLQTTLRNLNGGDCGVLARGLHKKYVRTQSDFEMGARRC
jgi:GAF domain-containing protein